MLRTIMIGTCVMVQGVFIRQLGADRIVVQVGERQFTGRPVIG